MSPRHIPGLTVPPTIETPGTRVAPKIGRLQLTMLQTCGINSLESLHCYLRRAGQEVAGEPPDVSQPASDCKFRVVTAEDLGFDNDSEHRLHEDNITVRDSILELSGLRLRNSETVEITNCIIIGDLNVSMSDKTLRKVYLDRCLVLGRILIYNVQSPDCKLEIGDSNCFALDVRSSEVKSLNILTCKVPALYLDNLIVGDLSIVGNQIAYARLCRVLTSTPRVDHEQFDLRQIAWKTPPRHDARHLPEGFFEIIRELSFGDEDREKLFQTLSFLRKHTALESDRRSLNTVRLIASSRSQRSFLGELTVRLLGAVQSPSRVLFAAAGIFLFMALIYRFLPLQFAQGQATIHLDFPTACYFSGVTMMTVGYGDIVPLGIARFLAVIESVLGITVWGVYVVALVRKYID